MNWNFFHLIRIKLEKKLSFCKIASNVSLFIQLFCSLISCCFFFFLFQHWFWWDSDSGLERMERLLLIQSCYRHWGNYPFLETFYCKSALCINLYLFGAVSHSYSYHLRMFCDIYSSGCPASSQQLLHLWVLLLDVYSEYLKIPQDCINIAEVVPFFAVLKT